MRGLFSLQGIPVMLTIGKLLGSVATGSNSPAVLAWYKKLLAEGTTLIALAIVTGMTAAALVIGIFFGAFIYLREIGLEPLEAVGIVGMFALAATGGLLFYTLDRLKRFRHIPTNIERMHSSNDDHETNFSHLFGKAGEVADAFVDGLRYPERERRRAGAANTNAYDRVH
jgi:hypothetical protein